MVFYDHWPLHLFIYSADKCAFHNKKLFFLIILWFAFIFSYICEHDPLENQQTILFLPELYACKWVCVCYCVRVKEGWGLDINGEWQLPNDSEIEVGM